MLARRVCALAAAQRHASRAASRPSQRWTRLHSSSPSSSSRSASVSKPSAATSATAQKLASEQAPPPTLNLDGVSDRELIRRLLTRPQRTWMWLFGSVFVGVTLMAFGPELKVGVSKHTADVASKSLQDETLQGHTRELASQIVQTVLNDPNVLDQASQFLQRLVVMDSTREALRALVVQTLNDPVTLAHVSKLAKHTVAVLLEDPATRKQVVDLLMVTVVDPKTKQSVLLLIEQLMRDEQTRRNLTQLFAHTFVQDPVKQTITSTLTESVHDVLSRVDIQNHAKQFVGTVVKDQTVQAQSGDAIWSTFMYAVTPAWLSWIWHPSGSSDASTAIDAAELAATIEKVVVVEGGASTTAQADPDSKTGAIASDSGGERAEETVRDLVVVTRKVPSPHKSTEDSKGVANTGGAAVSKSDGTVAEVVEDSLRKRMTARLPFARRMTTPSPAAGPKKSSSSSDGDAKRPNAASTAAGPEFTEEYEKRHWSGSGSGFL